MELILSGFLVSALIICVGGFILSFKKDQNLSVYSQNISNLKSPAYNHNLPKVRFTANMMVRKEVSNDLSKPLFLISTKN